MNGEKGQERSAVRVIAHAVATWHGSCNPFTSSDTGECPEGPMKKIEAVIKPFKLDEVK